MPPSPAEIISELDRAAQSISRSFDARALPEFMRSMPVGQMLALQEKIDTIRRPLAHAGRRLRDRDSQYVSVALSRFREALYALQSDMDVMSHAADVPFRFIGVRRHRAGEPILHDALIEGRLTVADAVRFLSDSVDAIPMEWLIADNEAQDPSSTASGTRALSRIVPREQVPAPAQFVIEDVRVKISHRPAAPRLQDSRNVAAAREDILQRGNKLIDELSRSNCDPRLIRSFRELQAKVASADDIVRVGITNIECTLLTDEFGKEIADATCALMKAHTVGISMYVAQFEEWQRFAEQATETALSNDDLPIIKSAANDILRRMESSPGVADDEVLGLFRELSAMVAVPSQAPKRVLFAVWRTIENFLITSYAFAGDVLEETAEKTKKGLSTVASTIIVTAVAGGLILGPIASIMPEGSWIRTATELVLKELRSKGIKLG